MLSEAKHLGFWRKVANILFSYMLTWLFVADFPPTVGAQEHQMIRPSKPKEGDLNAVHQKIPSLVVQVGQTTLKEVRRKLGKSGMPRGTGGEDQVCYVSENPDDHTLVRFSTHDWVRRDLLAQLEILADKRSFPKFNRCGKSPLITRDLMTASGLKLGLTKDQAKEILGADANDSGEYVAVDYDKLIPTKGKRLCYYLFTWAEARFANEQAISIGIGMLEEGACRE